MLEELVMKYVLIILALTATVSAQATAKEITDAECASIIVQETRDAYYRTRGPCACPEDRASDGSRCGGRSTRQQPPYCKPQEILQRYDEASSLIPSMLSRAMNTLSRAYRAAPAITFGSPAALNARNFRRFSFCRRDMLLCRTNGSYSFKLT